MCGVEVRRRIQAVANTWRKVKGAGLMKDNMSSRKLIKRGLNFSAVLAMV